MTDTNNNPVVTEQAPIITRNGISKTFTKSVFGKKSPNAGVEFYTPEFSVGEFENDTKWAGLDWFISLGTRAARKLFGDIHLDNIDKDTGKLNTAAWQADAEDFTSGVIKLKELEEEIEDLVSQSQVYLLDERFGETDDEGKPTPYALELSSNAVRVTNILKPLRAQKASIKAKYAERVAVRDAKEAAEKAKKASVAQAA